ncbi:hypothetical protein L3Y34_006892 [Caenorhabditis briggsae]|uniref:Uncharacterized protein n=2 Tax=Caenorhabditis briggsae TaxID=6238 RepID=A0AAE9A521_CAEBR|nr:hypothetical protein L3Y34_006892 [Caenorhabditis briggsae]
MSKTLKMRCRTFPRRRSVLLLFSILFVIFYIVNFILSTLSNISMYSCTIPFEGKDPNVFGYLCAVDRCVYEFFKDTEHDKFELMWRKLPDSLNWCSTNAQMSVTKFTSKKEVVMFKVKNMMERKKKNEAGDTCTAVVISFDDDRSLKDIDLERVLKTCTIHHIDLSSSRVQGLANVLKSFNTEVIDLLIVGPSKASSYLLFQQFLGQYYDYLPTVCQVNFAHSLPRAREENGFMESIQRLRSEKKFLLIGASKDRTDMHLNLFFENMDEQYCRNRYFRYLSYF